MLFLFFILAFHYLPHTDAILSNKNVVPGSLLLSYIRLFGACKKKSSCHQAARKAEKLVSFETLLQ